MYGDDFDWLYILCQTLEWKDLKIFLAGQGVLQMSQISQSYIHQLLNVFEDPAQRVHTTSTSTQ